MRVWAEPRYGKAPHNRIELEGKRFGSIVVGASTTYLCGQARWRYACDCGNSGIAYSRDIRAGKVTCCKACKVSAS